MKPTYTSLQSAIEPHLLRVTKPARYAGGETNMIRKPPDTQSIGVCLAFPDIYDIGQSYIGFHILYHILNGREGTLCERTFAPWPDMEEVMRREGLPLWSLENKLPVGSFDVVGFTLQYELHYTAVLNMLDLADIPLYTGERDTAHPFVIGGGTCCVNPEPIAPYFDAFLLGDGEEAFPEMLDVIEEARDAGVGRRETLRRLAEVEGVYVPSLYEPVTGPDGAFGGVQPVDGEVPLTVRSRIAERLGPEQYPEKPLVPLTEVVHDRLSVEIMRGCPRGCRFCGAGMCYRPPRLRPADEIISQVEKGIRSTGWEEVSLVSLSTTDHPELERIVDGIGQRLGGSGVSISLSSLRADNFSLKMAEATAGGRKSGLTFAVEAGTQRLRDVINKNLTEEQLFETVRNAFENGWRLVKLYFMIGLPTETDGDVRAIADLLTRLGTMAKKYKGRTINVTISPFTPKPATPFQWESRDSVGTLDAKLGLIKRELRSRTVRLKQTDTLVSALEGLLSRGGRDTAPLVLEAWKRGSRLDGWSEHFNQDRWLAVCAEKGIDLTAGEKALPEDRPLPWSHLDFGVHERYLRRERGKAIKGETTGDCFTECHACGPYAPLCEALGKERGTRAAESRPAVAPPAGAATETSSSRFGRRKKPVAGKANTGVLTGNRFRLHYGKEGAAIYTGHLDLVRIFDRTMRRAEIPIAYSQGFHPHPKFSFGPPLPLGMKSTAEYVDLTLREPCPAIERSLARGLPEGFRLLGIHAIPDKTESLSSLITAARYEVAATMDEPAKAAIRTLLEADSIPVTRRTKKGTKDIDIRKGISDVSVWKNGNGLTMVLRRENGRTVKPAEVLERIFGDDIPADITRSGQYAVVDGAMVSPMDSIW